MWQSDPSFRSDLQTPQRLRHICAHHQRRATVGGGRFVIDDHEALPVEVVEHRGRGLHRQACPRHDQRVAVRYLPARAHHGVLVRGLAVERHPRLDHAATALAARDALAPVKITMHLNSSMM